MRLGDTVTDAGGLKGKVVANIDTDEFSTEHSREQWGCLLRGVMVETEEAGLVHYEDAGEITVVASA